MAHDAVHSLLNDLVSHVATDDRRLGGGGPAASYYGFSAAAQKGNNNNRQPHQQQQQTVAPPSLGSAELENTAVESALLTLDGDGDGTDRTRMSSSSGNVASSMSGIGGAHSYLHHAHNNNNNSSRPDTPSDVARMIIGGVGEIASGGRRHMSTQSSALGNSGSSSSSGGGGIMSSPVALRALRASSSMGMGGGGSDSPSSSGGGGGLASPSVPLWSAAADKLFVRVGQPVESCDLEPWASVLQRTPTVGVDGITQPPALSFRWLRSDETLPCAYSNCITNRALEPDADPITRARAAEVLSNSARRRLQLQCMACVTNSVVAATTGASRSNNNNNYNNTNTHHQHYQQAQKNYYTSSISSSEKPSFATYCSVRCLRRGWREHAQYHLSDDASSTSSSSATSTEKDDILWRKAHSYALADAVKDTSSSSSSAIRVGLGLKGLELAGINSTNNSNKNAPTSGNNNSRTRTLGIQASGNSDDADVRSSAFADDAVDNAAPPGWKIIGDTKTIRPSAADVGHKLRLEVIARLSEDRSLRQVAESSFVLPRPPQALRRKFVLAEGVLPASMEKHARERLLRSISVTGIRDVWGSPTALRVLNYNILAEIYASQQQYPYVPLWQLSWAYRSKVILNELKLYDADVICLQEVQSDAFDKEILPFFSALGYAALYKTKTREVGLHGKIDGCAIFFKSSRLRLQPGGGYFVVELNDAATSVVSAEMNKLDAQLISRPPSITQSDYESQRMRLEQAQKRLCKDNVAQVAILQMIAGPGPDFAPLERAVPLLVVCTHLHWDPALADVKVWQMSCLIKEVEKLQTAAVTSLTSSGSGLLQPGQTSLPMLLCGDLNSEPDSAVYKLLSNNVTHGGRRVDLSPADLPHDPCSILPARRPLGHSMSLASLYSQIVGIEPQFTNLTRDFTGCLDYVFTNVDCVKPLSAAEVPRAEVLTGSLARNKMANSGSFGDFASAFRGAGGGNNGPDDALGSGAVNGSSNNNTVLGVAIGVDYDEPESDGSVALPNANHPSDHLPLIFEVDIAPWLSATSVVSSHANTTGGNMTLAAMSYLSSNNNSGNNNNSSSAMNNNDNNSGIDENPSNTSTSSAAGGGGMGGVGGVYSTPQLSAASQAFRDSVMERIASKGNSGPPTSLTQQQQQQLQQQQQQQMLNGGGGSVGSAFSDSVRRQALRRAVSDGGVSDPMVMGGGGGMNATNNNNGMMDSSINNNNGNSLGASASTPGGGYSSYQQQQQHAAAHALAQQQQQQQQQAAFRLNGGSTGGAGMMPYNTNNNNLGVNNANNTNNNFANLAALGPQFNHLQGALAAAAAAASNNNNNNSIVGGGGVGGYGDLSNSNLSGVGLGGTTTNNNNNGMMIGSSSSSSSTDTMNGMVVNGMSMLMAQQQQQLGSGMGMMMNGGNNGMMGSNNNNNSSSGSSSSSSSISSVSNNNGPVSFAAVAAGRRAGGALSPHNVNGGGMGGSGGAPPPMTLADLISRQLSGGQN